MENHQYWGGERKGSKEGGLFLIFFKKVKIKKSEGAWVYGYDLSDMYV